MLVIAYGGTPSDISYRFSSIDASALRLTGIWFCKIFRWVSFDLCHVQEMINISLLVPIGMIMFDGSVLYKDRYDKLKNQKPCTLEYRQVSNIREKKSWKKYTVRHHYYRIAFVASLAFDMLVIAYGGTPSDISYRFSSIDASALRLTGIWFCKIFRWVSFDLCHVQEMINMSLLVPIGMIMFDGSVLYKDRYDKLILDLTPGLKGLDKDDFKTRWESFKFWDLVRLILEILRYLLRRVMTWEDDHHLLTSCDNYSVANVSIRGYFSQRSV